MSINVIARLERRRLFFAPLAVSNYCGLLQSGFVMVCSGSFNFLQKATSRAGVLYKSTSCRFYYKVRQTSSQSWVAFLYCKAGQKIFQKRGQVLQILQSGATFIDRCYKVRQVLQVGQCKIIWSL